MKIFNILKLIGLLLLLEILPKHNYNPEDLQKIDRHYKDSGKSFAKYIQNEDTAKMKGFIISNPDFNIDSSDDMYGFSMLMWAIQYGHRNSVNALLELGANPNFISIVNGYTPLMVACEHFNPRIRNSNGRIQKQDIDITIIEKLLSYGAIANKVTLNYQTGYKQSALNKAAMRSLNCTKILIEKGGANPYLLVDSISILETAILFGRMDIASYLVDSCEMSLSAPSGFYKNGKRIYDVLKIADCSKGDSLNIQLKKKLLRQAEEKKHLADEL